MGDQGMPGVCQHARQMGWHMTAIPKPASALLGGVAILTKDPWCRVLLRSFSSEDAQLLMVSVGSPGCEQMVVVTGYKRPRAPRHVLDTLGEWLASLSHRRWVLSGDWNMDVTDSAFAQLCLAWHGSLVVSGCHARGTVPLMRWLWAMNSVVVAKACRPSVVVRIRSSAWTVRAGMLCRSGVSLCTESGARKGSRRRAGVWLGSTLACRRRRGCACWSRSRWMLHGRLGVLPRSSIWLIAA